METNNKIALVELPPIIYEGLLSVLKKHDSKLNFLRFSDYNEPAQAYWVPYPP